MRRRGDAEENRAAVEPRFAQRRDTSDMLKTEHMDRMALSI
jgi:hypothetical protein